MRVNAFRYMEGIPVLRVGAGNLRAVILAPPTQLVFVRHGETVANATGRYSAATLNTFTPKGRLQVAALTTRLRRLGSFDRIVVSPSERCLRTLAPYLRATGRTAEVWPLAYECCVGRLPARREPLAYGGRIAVPADLAGLYTVPRAARLPAPRNKAQEGSQLDLSLAEFRRRLSGGRILVVGHSGHGGKFLHALDGRWRQVKNAEPISLNLP